MIRAGGAGMRDRRTTTLLCLTIVVLFVTQSVRPQPAPQAAGSNTQILSTAKLEQLDSLVTAWMALRKAPALSLAIVVDNRMVFSKGYGMADVENSVPARADTAYRLASISKSLTATAVMQLAERGKLDLDAPIHTYCSAWPERQSVKGSPDKQVSITARQLLTHFAGVLHYKLGEPFNTVHFNTITEAVNAFKDEPLLVEPETKYSYSTPGYTLLGCAIEGACGVSYLDYLNENILKPAGMTRTQADNVYAIISNRARGYAKTAAGEVRNAPLHDTSGKIPAGGLVSTVEDLARFAIALNTGKLVKRKTLENMWTKPKARDGKESDYGFGFLIGIGKNGQRRIFNDGSQPGTRTYISMLPALGYAVTLMTNMEGAYCEELVPKITGLVFDPAAKTN